MARPVILPPAPSREDAISLGVTYYLGKRPCERQHEPRLRYTKSGHCVECRKITSNAWHQANPDARQNYATKHYQANAKMLCEQTGRWAKENREFVKQIQTAWRKAHPEAAAKIQSRWRKAHPGQVIAKAHRRRKLARNSTEHFTAADIQEIFALQRGRCACCRSKLKAVEARDHIVALARGGNNGRRNIQITCQPCNSRKGARDPIDFMRAEFGRLL